MGKETDAQGSADGTRARILLCDDSKVVRVTAKKIIADHFDLVMAEDGEVGWQMISSDNSIQLVFTDLKMPNLDGFGLIKRIRKSEVEYIRNMPVIVVTGATDDEDLKRQVFEVGATDFITKPFKATTLIARSEAHTDYRKINKELQASSNIDPAAGVLNRQGIEAQLGKDCAFVNRHKEKIAVMLFELDDFEKTYDSIGKKVAEQVVKKVSDILVNALRKEDSVGRIGLAQYLLVLPMVNSDSVVKLARRLSDRIKGFKLKFKSGEMQFTASAGIANIQKGRNTEASLLIEHAEQALQNARQVGPDQIQLIKLEAEERAAPSLDLSVDGILENIDRIEVTVQQLDELATRLAPLVARMNEDQKRTLMP